MWGNWVKCVGGSPGERPSYTGLWVAMKWRSYGQLVASIAQLVERSARMDYYILFTERFRAFDPLWVQISFCARFFLLGHVREGNKYTRSEKSR